MTTTLEQPKYVNVINIHMGALMPIAAYLQEIPRPFWVVAMVLGFVWFWPVGLIMLAVLISTKRSPRFMNAGCWQNTQNAGATGPSSAWGWGPGGLFGFGGSQRSNANVGGNRAFDEYRADTLRRLEEEQKEFMEYLERLRQARDKQEFDSFMADRRRVTPDANPAV